MMIASEKSKQQSRRVMVMFGCCGNGGNGAAEVRRRRRLFGWSSHYFLDFGSDAVVACVSRGGRKPQIVQQRLRTHINYYSSSEPNPGPLAK